MRPPLSSEFSSTIIGEHVYPLAPATQLYYAETADVPALEKQGCIVFESGMFVQMQPPAFTAFSTYSCKSYRTYTAGGTMVLDVFADDVADLLLQGWTIAPDPEYKQPIQPPTVTEYKQEVAAAQAALDRPPKFDGYGRPIGRQ